MPDGNTPRRGNSGGVAADELRSIVERVERLETEKRAIAEDIKDVYGEAKGRGFDTRTIRKIVKERQRTREEIQEEEALLDIYRAALGMLGDTPLGEAAIRRLSDKPKPPAAQPDLPEPPQRSTADESRDEDDDRLEPSAEQIVPAPVVDPGPTVEQAREMGRAAAADGHAVTANPFPARDPRRAAWDEEWCRAAGSDGMDLPPAWRRSAKPKPPRKTDADQEDAASGADAEQ